MINTLIYRLKRWAYTPAKTFVAGVALTLFAVLYVIPVVTTQVQAFVGSFSNDTVYVREEVHNEPTPEKLEVYYQEELEALKEKYEDAHRNAARSNAIERLEADLEAEKEQLRATELFR